MPGRLEFDLGFGRPGRSREESEPMRLLVMGDFSGKAAAERAPLATRPTHKVDIDNLAEVLRHADQFGDAASAAEQALVLFERKENRAAAAQAQRLLDVVAAPSPA